MIFMAGTEGVEKRLASSCVPVVDHTKTPAQCHPAGVWPSAQLQQHHLDEAAAAKRKAARHWGGW